MNVEQASEVLASLVAIRERHGESFAEARRAVFADERFAAYVAAYEGETATVAEQAGAVLDRRIEARLAETGDDPRAAVRAVIEDPKMQAWVDRWAEGKAGEDDEQSRVVDVVLKRARTLRDAAATGDVLDYVKQVLKADPALARAYRGLD